MEHALQWEGSCQEGEWMRAEVGISEDLLEVG